MLKSIIKDIYINDEIKKISPMRFLKFDQTRDFPYYKHNPRISKLGWLTLLLIIPIVFFISLLIEDLLISGVIFCFGLLIPILYFSKWDYTLLFHKPTMDEIMLGVLMFVGYIIYVIVVSILLEPTGLFSSGTPPYPEVIDLKSIISLLFSLMGEELLKFIPLMFFLRVFFKYTGNKKISIIISSILVMIGFGLLHYDFESPIVAFLLMQGFGTVFEIIGYVKTKNILISYLSHVLTDVFLLVISVLEF
ncbi:MAG: hypothetical protein IKF11_11555 [Methanobrevibacter sp.]|nr:hypothetical protein [Methanobrevibacter sp.]